MKDTTRRYLIIAALFIAVFVLVTAKNFRTQKQAEGLADDSIIGKGKPVLLELGFMSNPDDLRLLHDEAYKKKMVTAIADGIEDYLKKIEKGV